MTFDPTKPVRTRDGEEAIIVHQGRPGWYSLTALIGPTLVPKTFTKDGQFRVGELTSADLVNIPEKHVRWINLYPCVDSTYGFESRADADKAANHHRIACRRIEFEEGQFDD